MSDTRCGVVAIVGRPNVGKSTLMNHLIGEKVSITSRKPQTTRHRIHGILSRPGYQIVFADTPGIHTGQERALNRAMNDAAQSALSDVDVICFMVDALKWTEGDEHVLSLLQRAGDTPVILLVNKVDNLPDKSLLLPHLESLAARFAFAEVIPVSALRDHNLDVLEKALSSRLPEGDFWFDDDQLTDRELVHVVLYERTVLAGTNPDPVDDERLRAVASAINDDPYLTLDAAIQSAADLSPSGP